MDCYGVVSIIIIPLIEWICGNGFAGSYFRAFILSVGAMHSQEMICPFAAILPPNASPLLRLTPMAKGGLEDLFYDLSAFGTWRQPYA